MTFSTIATDTIVTAPTLTPVIGGKTVMAVRSTRRRDNRTGNPQTTILLTSKVARAAGFRKGARVSVQLGTGRDSGTARIVANRNGAYRLGATSEGSAYSLRIRTSRLFNETTSTESVTVTGVAKGALAFAY